MFVHCLTVVERSVILCSSCANINPNGLAAELPSFRATGWAAPSEEKHAAGSELATYSCARSC